MSNKEDVLLELVIKSLICLQDLAIQQKIANKWNNYTKEEFAHYVERSGMTSADGKSIDQRAKETFEEIQNVLNTQFMDDVVKEKFAKILGAEDKS